MATKDWSKVKCLGNYGGWSSEKAMLKDFDAPADALKGCTVLIAYYDGHYGGEAFVLYRKSGKLYEVNGSHCSCYGLEDQWNPEVTSKEALLMRKRWSQGDGVRAAVEAL